MKKSLFHISVALIAAILFLTVTTAHACIERPAAHHAHDHSVIQSAGLGQSAHGEAQDENCRSVRDRFISLAPGSTDTLPLVASLDLIPTIGDQTVAALQRFTAERPPGPPSIGDNQSPLYIFNSVFRI
jgi:hypothetical protein